MMHIICGVNLVSLKVSDLGMNHQVFVEVGGGGEGDEDRGVIVYTKLISILFASD